MNPQQAMMMQQMMGQQSPRRIASAEPVKKMVVHDRGKNIEISSTNSQSYTPREWLDLLSKLRENLVLMDADIDNIKVQMSNTKEDIKKYGKYEDKCLNIIRSGIKNMIEEHKKSDDYKKIEGESQQKAWLFSQRNLQSYAPEYLLKEAIFPVEKEQYVEEKK